MAGQPWGRRSRSFGRNRGLSIFIIIVIVLVVIEINQSDPTNPVSAPVQSSSALSSYALAPDRNTWPALDESGGGSGINPDALTATNYYLILDGSGSMTYQECSGNKAKIEVAVDAMKTFVDATPADARLGLAVFDRGGLSERVALGANNREQLKAALNQVAANGGTPLRSALKLGYRRLTEQARAQLGYGEYHLVVVTDGDADPRSEDPANQIAYILEHSPVVLHTVGFCISDRHSMNQAGRTLYTAANSPQALRKGLSDVLAEAPIFDLGAFSD